MGERRRWATVLGLSILLSGATGPVRSAPGAELPDGFTDELVTNAPAPTALAFLPDGRMLIATQPGRLHVQTGDGLLGPVTLDLSTVTCSNLERGLLGVAADPDFATNPFIYTFYTVDLDGDCVHRVSRWRLEEGRADPASEEVLIDRIPSANANHNGGDLAFGPDGHLYVSVGDGGCDYEPGGFCAGGNNASRDEHVLLGKILRITRTGDVPADNPFRGPDADRCSAGGTTRGRRCQETFAWGLRNPYRFAFDPRSPEARLFVNDVGQHHWEEINEAVAGADYGWNVREGACPNGQFKGCGPVNDGLTDPIHSYRHDGNCGAITGGAFVPEGVWPDGWDGAYLFGDYNCGTIFRLRPDGAGRFRSEPFARRLGMGGPVHMVFGPWGDGRALYYTSYARGGEVRRIAFTGDANRPPVAALAVNRTGGPAPLTVDFDASASTDPDGDKLTYEWDFGDGSQIERTTKAQRSHTYEAEGVHRTVLVVRDPAGAASAPVEWRVGAGRAAPEIVLDAPEEPFHVGRKLSLSAQAHDAEDGRLPDVALSWTLVLHHDDHTHPYVGPVTGSAVATAAPAPESLSAAESAWLEVRVTATDSEGLSTTLTHALRPRMVPVRLRTVPEDLDLVVNGVTVAGPAQVMSWAGWDLDVEARRQIRDGVAYRFASWSDGGPARHSVATPATGVELTAKFVPDQP